MDVKQRALPVVEKGDNSVGGEKMRLFQTESLTMFHWWCVPRRSATINAHFYLNFETCHFVECDC